MTRAKFNPYENAWNLMKQIAFEYCREKKYLTKREVNYIIRICERGIKTYTALNAENKQG